MHTRTFKFVPFLETSDSTDKSRMEALYQNSKSMPITYMMKFNEILMDQYYNDDTKHSNVIII